MSYSKGTNKVETFINWLDKKEKLFQEQYILVDDIKEVYEKYLFESTQGTTSSKITISAVKKWTPNKSNFEKRQLLDKRSKFNLFVSRKYTHYP